MKQPAALTAASLRPLTPFIVAALLAWLCRTPNAWSSQDVTWLPALLITPLALMCFAATHRIFVFPDRFAKLQAVGWWLVFGGVFTASVCRLATAQQHLASCHRPGPFDYLHKPSKFFVPGAYSYPGPPRHRAVVALEPHMVFDPRAPDFTVLTPLPHQV